MSGREGGNGSEVMEVMMNRQQIDTHTHTHLTTKQNGNESPSTSASSSAAFWGTQSK